MLPLKSFPSRVSSGASDIISHGTGHHSFAVSTPTSSRPRGESSISYDGDRKSSCQVLPWRVFINHIDSYHAGKLADLLSESLYIPVRMDVSSSSEDEGEEGENEEDAEREKDDGSDLADIETKGHLLYGTESEQLPRKFELIATALDHEHFSKEDVKVIPSLEKNKEKFMCEVSQCGFIIYDITQDNSQIEEANWVLNELIRRLEDLQKAKPKAFKSTQLPYHFILISSIMTWARTKALTDGDEEAELPPLTEANFRKRKAHANFKEHIKCERTVATAARKHPNIGNKLKPLVLCAGITYGEEEGDLHYVFRLGWSNEKWLPVVGSGENLIPLLHVRDLASAVYVVMKEWPKLRYVVAVERGPASQKNLIKAVSRALSTGNVKSILPDEAILHPEITQRVFDVITIDLNILPEHLINSKAMKWQSDKTFCDNIDVIIQEYRNSRNLHPVKIIVLGPPASGKTMIARELARHYQLHYISIKKLITDTIQQLANEIENKNRVEEGNDDENEKEEDDVQVTENCQEILDEIQNGLQENNGRLESGTLTKIFRRKLLSKECQNQGYIVDGYPKTLEQAFMLFGQEDNPDEEHYETEAMAQRTLNAEVPSSPVMPELVIVLIASDDFLIARVINLPEKNVQNTAYTEERMYERLQMYREENDDENTPLQVFDELEIHPIIVDIEEDTSPQMLSTFRYCLSMIGPPRNYGPSLEEMEEEKRRAEACAAAEAALAAAERERENAERRRERDMRSFKWMELLEQLKHEEEEQLSVMSEPLRHYLVKYVFPTLTKGLIEVAKLRPDDPIDYLAEYLFKENPEGRPYEPDYSEAMSATLSAIQQLHSEGRLTPGAVAADDEAYQHLSDESKADEEDCLCEVSDDELNAVFACVEVEGSVDSSEIRNECD